MRITVLDYDNNENKVWFSSEIGEGTGIWADREKPFYRDYSVKLSVEDVISSRQIETCPGCSPEIKVVGKSMVFVGKVTLGKPGQFISVDLGIDLYDFGIDESVSCEELVGKYVSITAERVKIYDEHFFYG